MRLSELGSTNFVCLVCRFSALSCLRARLSANAHDGVGGSFPTHSIATVRFRAVVVFIIRLEPGRLGGYVHTY